jgi:hypothetical protein
MPRWGTLVSEPFRAAVRGSEGIQARWFTEQFRTAPPLAQASLLVKGKCDGPFWADSADLGVQQVGGYPGYTGRDGNIVAQAALDPKRTSDMTGARHAQHTLTGRGP